MSASPDKTPPQQPPPIEEIHPKVAEWTRKHHPERLASTDKTPPPSDLLVLADKNERLEAEVVRLQEALRAGARLTQHIGEWFIREDPDVPKWFEDAVLELERTTREALGG